MAGIVSLSTALLDPFVGKSIETICPLGFGKIGDAHNHCAHFVGHVLKLNGATHIGLTCAGMASGGKAHPAAGACLRVNEIFNACDDLEAPDESGCLVYYTLRGNMHRDGTMGDMSKKHVGIYFQEHVYNYGNTHDQVRKDSKSALKHLYGKDTITRYTAFPDGATALTLAEIQALG